MNWKFLFGNFVLAIFFFILNGMIGKIELKQPNIFEYHSFSFWEKESNFSGNFFAKIVNPSVYLAIAAAIVQVVGKIEFAYSLWILVPMFWLIRWGHSIIRNIIVFLNITYELVACLVSIGISQIIFWGIVRPLLENHESVWIPATALRDALWFGIIAYLAKIIWDILRTCFTRQNVFPMEKSNFIIIKRYEKFLRKYKEIVEEEIDDYFRNRLNDMNILEIENLVFAIMIYEDYNRPASVRMVENVVKFFCRQRVMTMGIMQVTTVDYINSKKSVRMATHKICSEYIENRSIYKIIREYNPGDKYYSEVKYILERIKEYNKESC